MTLRIQVVMVWAGLSFGTALAQSGPNAGKGDPFTAIHPDALTVDVGARIHARTAGEVERIRRELIAFIWKNQGLLPSETAIERENESLPGELKNCRATAEKWLVRMPLGFQSVVHYYQPHKANQRLALFHQGHDALWTGGADQTVALPA